MHRYLDYIKPPKTNALLIEISSLIYITLNRIESIFYNQRQYEYHSLYFTI